MSSEFHQLFKALATHESLIVEAYKGELIGGGKDKQRVAAIDLLLKMGLLKPFEEDVYRLNPMLRTFLSDYQSTFHAFQALQRVDAITKQADTLWVELARKKEMGLDGTRDFASIAYLFDDAVANMSYAVERNLSLLHALLSTQYGNVEDLTTKLRQNEFYQKQVVVFLRELNEIQAFVAKVADDALAKGLVQARRMVLSRLASKMVSWTGKVKDAQAVIYKRAYIAKLMQERLQNLARFSLWLDQDKTTDGWELDVNKDTRPVLFGPSSIKFNSSLDVSDDSEELTMPVMLKAVQSMPSPKETDAQKRLRDELQQPEPDYFIVEDDDDEPLLEVVDPTHISIMDLSVKARCSTEPISMLAFKRAYPALEKVGDEEWLIYASVQLKALNLDVTYLLQPTNDLVPMNEFFYDALVQCMHSKQSVG